MSTIDEQELEEIILSKSTIDEYSWAATWGDNTFKSTIDEQELEEIILSRVQ